MLDAAALEEARTMVAALANATPLNLTPLTSLPEVLAFCATTARSDDSVDEADMAEIVIRLAGVAPAEARSAAKTLRLLGYDLVASRLEQVAGRRRTTLVPVPA